VTVRRHYHALTTSLGGTMRRSVKDALRPYVLTARRIFHHDLRLSDIGYARAISYSQFGEDLWLARRFERQAPGFYVDVGAYDPFNASNTLLLYRRGWTGINIEPNPAALARLLRFRPRDINLGVAISDRAGEANFIIAGSFSGLETPDHLWSSQSPTRTIVATRRLDSVLAEHRALGEIDLLDVDCEGHELTVLRSNDWERFRPTVVLVESHPSSGSGADAFLAQAGYRRLERLGLTVIFERVA
jgi:FkbM family methyltransferase